MKLSCSSAFSLDVRQEAGEASLVALRGLLTDWSRKVRAWIKGLFQKEQLDQEMDEELRAHIQLQTQENIDSGMSASQARAAAFKDFGSVESIKETCRAQRAASGIDTLLRDMEYG